MATRLLRLIAFLTAALFLAAPAFAQTPDMPALVNALGQGSFPEREAAINALVAKPADSDPLASLTHRERTVLQLAAEGHSNPEIAEKLFISPRTAETHRTNLLRKLGLQTQTDLVRFAIRKGLISA